MPDDNRFAGLSDVVEEELADEGEDENGDDFEAGDATDRETSASTETETEIDTAGDTDTAAATDTDSGSDDDPAAVTYDDSEHEAADSEDDESDGADTESEDDDTSADPAAFPFDATTKKTVYVRGETIDDLEDARALVDAQLRTEHDVRDLTGREFYDAVFRLAADDTDGLIEEIRDERAD